MEQKTKEVNNKPEWREKFVVNIVLFVLGSITSISGLIIQYHYHLLKSPNESSVFMLNRMEWNAVHVWTSIVFLLAVICHLRAHRTWYGNALKRNLFPKHRATVVLTFLTIIVVISGLIPLLIYYFGGNSILRFSIIEIHDKIAIPFLVLAFLHTIKRLKWYSNVVKSKF